MLRSQARREPPHGEPAGLSPACGFCACTPTATSKSKCPPSCLSSLCWASRLCLHAYEHLKNRMPATVLIARHRANWASGCCACTPTTTNLFHAFNPFFGHLVFVPTPTTTLSITDAQLHAFHRSPGILLSCLHVELENRMPEDLGV